MAKNSSGIIPARKADKHDDPKDIRNRNWTKSERQSVRRTGQSQGRRRRLGHQLRDIPPLRLMSN